MIREEILPFLNKRVTLVKGNNFVLTGIITQVNTESIVFETDQATSAIDIGHIREIVFKREGNNALRY